MAGGVPEGQLNMYIIDEDVMDVVFEDSWLVYGRKVPAITQGASDRLRWVIEIEPTPW